MKHETLKPGDSNWYKLHDRTVEPNNTPPPNLGRVPTGTLLHSGHGCPMPRPLWKTTCLFFYDPAVSLLFPPNKWKYTYPKACRNVHKCVLSRSVASDSLQPHGLEPASLPCPWGFPGKNTGDGQSFPLQGTRGLTEPGSPELQLDSLLSEPLGNPLFIHCPKLSMQEPRKEERHQNSFSKRWLFRDEIHSSVDWFQKDSKQWNTIVTAVVISECLYTGQINRKWEVAVNIHHDQMKLIYSGAGRKAAGKGILS